MSPGVYIVTVYRDRPREVRWLARPKRVDTFKTTLDLEDPASLDNALVGAARRDRGDEADMDMYRLEVTGPDGSVLTDWRYNGWAGEDGDVPERLYGY